MNGQGRVFLRATTYDSTGVTTHDESIDLNSRKRPRVYDADTDDNDAADDDMHGSGDYADAGGSPIAAIADNTEFADFVDEQIGQALVGQHGGVPNAEIDELIDQFFEPEQIDDVATVASVAAAASTSTSAPAAAAASVTVAAAPSTTTAAATTTTARPFRITLHSDGLNAAGLEILRAFHDVSDTEEQFVARIKTLRSELAPKSAKADKKSPSKPVNLIAQLTNLYKKRRDAGGSAFFAQTQRFFYPTIAVLRALSEASYTLAADAKHLYCAFCICESREFVLTHNPALYVGDGSRCDHKHERLHAFVQQIIADQLFTFTPLPPPLPAANAATSSTATGNPDDND